MQVLHPAQITAPLQARQLQGLVRQARQDWLSRYLPPTRGAACTLASLVYADGQVCAVHSGDARISRLRILRVLAAIYVDFFRGTPLLVQIFLVFAFGYVILIIPIGMLTTYLSNKLAVRR